MKLSLPADRPLRILVTRTDRIGDLVLSTPVFSELRKHFPDAWIAGLTFIENREIIEGNADLSEVILYDKKGREKSWRGNLRFAARLRAQRFDLAIHLHATNRMHWVTLLAGIPVRLGWDRRLPWALTHVLPYVKKEGRKHEAFYNFDLLEPLGIEAPEVPETSFPVSRRAEMSLAELMFQKEILRDRPWVVLAPGASDPAKRWPAEGFAGVAQALSQNREVRFLTVGTRRDREAVRALMRLCRVPVTDLSGLLTLGMLGALLQKSTLLISNDSGPVHIAQALGIPVISVFVRTQPGLNPERWRPLYKNSRVIIKESGSPKNSAAYDDILEAAEALWPQKAGRL